MRVLSQKALFHVKLRGWSSRKVTNEINMQERNFPSLHKSNVKLQQFRNDGLGGEKQERLENAWE